MNRRTTLKLIGAGGLMAGLGGVGWLNANRDHAALGLDLMQERLAALSVMQIETTGAWDVSRTLDHLAQSIEFSIDGFPELKPKLFRTTVGPLAFSVFQARSAMSHELDEPIPGETIVMPPTNPAAAKTRLIAALTRFQNHQGALAPHFAYGVLAKQQYGLARAMHINNHLDEFANA